MYARRRPIKSVYGRGRLVPQSDLLWEEAILASPLRKPAAEITHPALSPKDIQPEERLPKEATDLRQNCEDRKLDTRILAETDPNALGPVPSSDVPRVVSTSRQKKAASVPVRGSEEHDGYNTAIKHICDEENMSLLEPPQSPILNDLPQPLTASTPINGRRKQSPLNLTASHIRFDSSLASDVSSPAPAALVHTPSQITAIDGGNDSSELSSVVSGSDLGDLTDAFQGLNTAVDITADSLAETSVADEQVLLDIDTLYVICKQAAPDAFDNYVDELLTHSTLRKLGEASFSEVFLSKSCKSGDETVLKIIPFGENEDEVPINDIIQELRISSAMSTVEGYVKIYSSRVVQGTYPKPLLDLWDQWHEERTSESDRPDWYKSDQKYCIIRLENAGTDLEHFSIGSWQQARKIFTKITQALALGEELKEFEHRDLHWGNVLVRDSPTEGDPIVTIIDYTLSRALVKDELSDLAFYGFADRAIFEAEGDDYQFEIYRLMRDSITDGNSDWEAKDWTLFHPTTNVLWLHYLVDKLIYSKDLKKPSSRVTKRNPVKNEAEIAAWSFLESTWKLLDPRRRYKNNEPPIDSAVKVLGLLQ